MSRERTEIVARAYEAFQRRDFDAIERVVDRDVRFTSLLQESEGAVYRGHEGVREYIESILEVLPDWRPTVAAIEEHGDSVLVKARVLARSPGTDVVIEQIMWQVVRFRGDRVAEWDFFRREDEARAALGRRV